MGHALDSRCALASWSMTMRNLKVMGVALSALALSACVVAPYPRYGAQAYPAYPANAAYDEEIAVANMAPPPPYAEVIPAIPFAGAIWLSGYWGWSGGRHAWVGGRWDHPRPGHVWAPHRWVQGGGGQWHLHGGGWVRR
jgi:hypothetical protein